MMKRHKSSDAKSPQQWAVFAKGILKAELAKRDVSYPQLVELLKGLGVEETPENLANKINRGKFSAIFLFQCLEAVGCPLIRLRDE